MVGEGGTHGARSLWFAGQVHAGLVSHSSHAGYLLLPGGLGCASAFFASLSIRPGRGPEFHAGGVVLLERLRSKVARQTVSFLFEAGNGVNSWLAVSPVGLRFSRTNPAPRGLLPRKHL